MSKIAVLTMMPNGIEFQVRNQEDVEYLEVCIERGRNPFGRCYIAYEGESETKSVVSGEYITRVYILERD